MVASVAQPVMTTIPRRKTDLQISFRKLVLFVGFMKISSKSHEERMQTHDPFFKTLNAPEIEIPGWRELSCLAAGSAGIASLRECAIAQAVEPDSSVKAWKFGCRARRREGKRRKGAWERGLVIRGVGREVRGSAVPRMPDRGRSADKTTASERQQRAAPESQASKKKRRAGSLLTRLSVELFRLGLDLVVHASHPTHSTSRWHRGSLLLLRSVRDGDFGGEQESADGSGVLQGAAGDLRRIRKRRLPFPPPRR